VSCTAEQTSWHNIKANLPLLISWNPIRPAYFTEI
jgi:hypothetical protein